MPRPVTRKLSRNAVVVIIDLPRRCGQRHTETYIVTLAGFKAIEIVPNSGGWAGDGQSANLLPACSKVPRWSAGTRLVVESTAEGVLLKLAPLFPPSSIDQVFGSLKHKGAALSVEDMETAVAAEAKRRARD